MATAQFAQSFRSDLDMNNYFDFDPNIVSRPPSRSSVRATPTQLFLDDDTTQVFAGPSHDYDRFPQQTGVVAGDVRNLDQSVAERFPAFNTWDLDSDLNMDMSQSSMFNNKFVDPSYIESEEPQSNVGRLWPGMHQQAALAKAQQAPQQFQSKGKARVNSASDPHTEESISRLLSQMRHKNSLTSVPEEDDGPGMSNMARMRKEEEDMDEDERLLASEEGKKLSSKERRQLRNKVSARAFRSRRKEYIGQLEGEVAAKAQEVTTLQSENTALTEENARYRALIQTLLRHPSFTPFIEDISKDPAFINSQISRRSHTPAQNSQVQQMGEAPVDLSMLKMAGNQNFQQPAFDFAQPQMFPGQSFPQQHIDQPRQNSFY